VGFYGPGQVATHSKSAIFGVGVGRSGTKKSQKISNSPFLTLILKILFLLILHTFWTFFPPMVTLEAPKKDSAKFQGIGSRKMGFSVQIPLWGPLRWPLRLEMG
jgi:hypothetical protein